MAEETNVIQRPTNMLFGALDPTFSDPMLMINNATRAFLNAGHNMTAGFRSNDHAGHSQ